LTIGAALTLFIAGMIYFEKFSISTYFMAGIWS
jgi:hypothetical protein